MNTRRVSLAVAAASGGLLTATLLTTAVAVADDYEVLPGSEVFPESQVGMAPSFDAISGLQVFDEIDTTTSTSTNYDVVGQYAAQVSEIYLGSTSAPFNEEAVVLAAQGSTGGSAADGDVPQVTSVLDVTNFGGGFENVYSDLALEGTAGTNVITDTFDTPFGDFNIPTDYDATATLGNIILEYDQFASSILATLTYVPLNDLPFFEPISYFADIPPSLF